MSSFVEDRAREVDEEEQEDDRPTGAAEGEEDAEEEEASYNEEDDDDEESGRDSSEEEEVGFRAGPGPAGPSVVPTHGTPAFPAPAQADAIFSMCRGPMSMTTTTSL